jgi:hypothetical protein
LLGGHGCLAGRDDDVHLEADQLGGETWEPFVSSLRPPVLDADVTPFDIAKLAESPLERFDKGVGRRAPVQQTDAGDLTCLLRLGGKRHNEDCKGRKQDENGKERGGAHGRWTSPDSAPVP